MALFFRAWQQAKLLLDRVFLLDPQCFTLDVEILSTAGDWVFGAFYRLDFFGRRFSFEQLIF